MSAKELIALAYEAHIKDHTATADFEVCSNPLCQLASSAEAEISAKGERIVALEKIIQDARNGNYDNAHDITAIRKFLYESMAALKEADNG